MSQFSLWSFVTLWFFTLNLPCARGAELWQQKTDVPVPRLEANAVLVNDHIYLMGGLLEGKGATDLVQIYNVQTGEWKAGQPLPARLHHVGLEAFGDDIYVFGGMDNNWIQKNSLHIFNTKTNSWTTGPNLPVALAAFGHVTFKKKMYFFGGQTPTKLNDQVYCYDPVTKEWSAVSTLPHPREHLAAAVIDQNIYVVGGRKWSLDTNSGILEVFNPEKNTWRQLSDMPTPRGGMTTVTHDNKLYVFGGETTAAALKQIEVYEPITNSWSSKDAMPVGRHGHGSVVVGDEIYVISGGTQPDWSFSVLNSVYKINSGIP